jgi:hypothetical protein
MVGCHGPRVKRTMPGANILVSLANDCLKFERFFGPR